MKQVPAIYTTELDKLKIAQWNSKQLTLCDVEQLDHVFCVLFVVDTDRHELFPFNRPDRSVVQSGT